MLIVISPAKTLDFETPVTAHLHSTPVFTAQANQLAAELRKMAPQELSRLMGISDKLGVLNYDRYRAWRAAPKPEQCKQALLAFKGDVYTGMQAETFNAADLQFAQQRLRILSGLYGVLKPMDLMQAYRLEMGTPLTTTRGNNLYAFWDDKVTGELNRTLEQTQTDVLINLASQEYFKAVLPARLHARVVSPVFKDWKKDNYKIISFFAKRARGMMTAYIIKNHLSSPRQLLDFAEGGYCYNAAMSSPDQPVFIRRT